MKLNAKQKIEVLKDKWKQNKVTPHLVIQYLKVRKYIQEKVNIKRNERNR